MSMLLIVRGMLGVDLPLAGDSLHPEGYHLALFLSFLGVSDLGRQIDNKLGLVLGRKPGVENLHVGYVELSRHFSEFGFGFSCAIFLLLFPALGRKTLQELRIALGEG